MRGSTRRSWWSPPGADDAAGPVAVAAIVVLTLVIAVTIVSVGAASSRRHQQWALDQLPFESLHTVTDGSGVVVAVLDTAIAAGHQDLAGVLLAGYDFIEDRPYDPVAPDRQTSASDHGTMIASIIAAPDDGVGVTGAAPGVRILPVRIVPDAGQGNAGDMASGIEWALDHGADVINISIRTTRDSGAVRAAVERAQVLGVPVVASAGLGPTTIPFYPAAYDETIAVTAIDASSAVYRGSPAMGYVELAAPGAGIVSAGGISFDDYRSGSGTSFAAPHVSALVALMRAASPDSTVAEIRNVLSATASDLGAQGRDPVFGFGLIDPKSALGAIAEPKAPESVSATVLGNREVVAWAPVIFATGYEVLRDGLVVAVVDEDVTSTLVPLRTPGTVGEVGVRAIGFTGARGTLVDAAKAPARSVSASLRSPANGDAAYRICDRCFPADLARLRGLEGG